VPTVMRVERLIHLELADQRVMKKCDACGKEHREWFEVEATKDGVKKVDEVVKRWVDWAERAERANE
jgi:murein endopeptidase